MSTNQSKKTDKEQRENYIMGLIDGSNPKVAALLSKTTAEHCFSIIDICVIYNILQYVHKKSRANYPVGKIIKVIKVTLENATAAAIPPVELSKRIAGTLFHVKVSRAVLNEIEQKTRAGI